MATVESITRAVYQGVYQDGMTAGANASAQAMGKLGVAVAETDQKVTRSTPSLKQLNTTLDENAKVAAAAERANNRLEAQLRGIQQAHGAGKISAEQAADLERKATVQRDLAVVSARRQADAMRQAYGATAEAGRVTTQQLQQLTPQLNDIFTSLTGGMSPFMVLTQQGPQITQVFGGLRNTLAAIPPQLMAVGAAAAVFGTLIASGEQAERALKGMQNRLGATRDDFLAISAVAEAAARRVTETSGVRLGDARTAAGTIGSARGFSGTQQDMERLLRLSEDLGARLGIDVPAAAQKLKQGLEDPASLARELATSGFRGFNATVARNIELLQLGGDKGRASAEVLRLIGAASDGAGKNVTEMQKAFKELGDVADALGNRLAPVATAMARIAGIALQNPSALIGTPAGVIGGLARRYILGQGATPAGEAAGGAAPAGAPIGDQQRPLADRINDALGDPAIAGSRIARLEDVMSRIARRRAMLGQGTPQENARMQAGLADLRGQALGLRGPYGQEMERQGDALRIAQTDPGAERTLMEAEIRFRRQGEREGGVSEGQVADVRAAEQERLTEQAREYSGALQRQADGELRVTEAMRGGILAGQQMEEQVRAEEEARRFAVKGTEQYTREVERLTFSYGMLREAQQRRASTQAIRTQEDQLALIEREITLVGASERARSREIAMLRERQRIIGERQDVNTPENQRRIELAGQLSDRSLDLARYQSAFSEIANLGERAFDRIGSAITEAFAKGGIQSLKFSNIFRAVLSEISQSVLKLAVLNPILNGLFGGNRGTLGDIVSGGGQGFGGGGGLVGGLANWVGGLVGGGGGGAGAFGGFKSDTIGGADFFASWSANGNAFAGGNVIPFATGGIVDRPTMFPMSRGRTGMMGEAGPEAIIPLQRGRDGKLGLASAGGGGAVTININSPDADGFRRTRRQIATMGAQMLRGAA